MKTLRNDIASQGFFKYLGTNTLHTFVLSAVEWVEKMQNVGEDHEYYNF